MPARHLAWLRMIIICLEAIFGTSDHLDSKSPCKIWWHPMYSPASGAYKERQSQKSAFTCSFMHEMIMCTQLLHVTKLTHHERLCHFVSLSSRCMGIDSATDSRKYVWCAPEQVSISDSSNCVGKQVYTPSWETHQLTVLCAWAALQRCNLLPPI